MTSTTRPCTTAQSAAKPQIRATSLTEDQAEFATGYAMLPAMQELEAEMKKSGFGFEIDLADGPDALVEPDDMTMIAPPCHEWEPLKVPEESSAPYYCLLCGQAFAI